MTKLPKHIQEALKQGHVVYYVSPKEAVTLYPYHELVLEVPLKSSKEVNRDSLTHL